MRLKSSYVFVGVVVAAVALYFIVRTLLGSAAPAKAEVAAAAPQPPTVQIVLALEQTRPYEIVLRGRTEPARSVIVRSETPGVVAQTPATEGSLVKKGAVLCRLEVDARQAALDQARAALRSRQLQQQASLELAKKGYRSPTQVLQDQAALDGAKAAVRQAEIALEQVNIRAPFTGVFDRRAAEIGAYLSPGDACGAMIELDPLLVVGDVAETDSAKLKVGAAARAKLLSGQILSGRVRYVAQEADPQTRTYRVEVAAPNPGLDARSGLSAEIRIGAGEGPAHLAPVSALVLDAAGRQGVRYVLPDNRVAFAPVTVLEETPQGAWIAGLTGAVRVITVGQSYVGEGQKVRVAVAR
jgi:multidrug efflux system membrane fusion protein